MCRLPLAMPPASEDEEIVRKPSTDEPFSALAFKVATHRSSAS